MTEPIDRRTLLGVVVAAMGTVALRLPKVAAASEPEGAHAGRTWLDPPRYETSVETGFTSDGTPYVEAVSREA